MTVTVVEAPDRVLDLDLVKAHLRVEFNDEDELIQALGDAAVAALDGPTGWLGRALGVQTLEAVFDAFCGERLLLPCRPLLTIVSVKYDDVDGVERTLDPAAYSLTADGVLRAYGTVWPSTRAHRDSVRVRYTAGYPDGIPAPIRAALMLMVGDLYANRETTVTSQVFETPMSTTVERLLTPFRVWRF